MISITLYGLGDWVIVMCIVLQVIWGKASKTFIDDFPTYMIWHLASQNLPSLVICMHAAHCTLHTLYSIHCNLHTILVHFALYAVHCTPYIVQCAEHCTVCWTLHWTQHTLFPTAVIVRCTLYNYTTQLLAQLSMHLPQYTDADALMLVHWWWCTDYDALIMMQWRWCTDADALMMTHWCWCTDDRDVKHFSWLGFQLFL